MVLDLQGLARSGLMTGRCLRANKNGRSDVREGSGWFYNIKVPIPKKPQDKIHAIEILRKFLPLVDSRGNKQIEGNLSFSNFGPEVITEYLLSKSRFYYFRKAADLRITGFIINNLQKHCY